MNLRHFNYLCIKVDETTSTNDLMWKYFKEITVEEGTFILAKNQTNGKGQKGNVWLVEPGKNLTMSVGLTPNIPAKNAAYMNVVAALAIHKTLLDLNIDAQIKWPNDILVNEKKICGILVENQIQGKFIQKAVVGIGLNVNQTIFADQINATSLANQIDKQSNIESIAKSIHLNLDAYYSLLKDSNIKQLTLLYYQHLYRINVPCKYADSSGTFIGIIQGIDAFGRLKVKKENNRTKIYDIKEITYL
ncbi:biotin--[acetyl-CoA-carboxylase] ligase [Putridiphycobacter roseus]|uniref:Biotin--[acetyl-CoA-carboxylase] ligase n=1 Tax=Putridiphycobacter roseus TaxID=2219161 RepID=A0A2W1NQF0_9FLAO|nr:biotin--[acetyl-CoA-carboxylase] ligase [Putridiphycobacter roseus]PZE16868.1 biotin--[acetyl-CoA-carboxylase] ligase [Putridiphycobacter roseus]